MLSASREAAGRQARGRSPKSGGQYNRTAMPIPTRPSTSRARQFVLGVAGLAAVAVGSSVATGQPAVPGANVARLARIDGLIEDAMTRDGLPGAVVVVGHGGRVVYEKAFGQRALVPEREPMTLDTIFDAASLTKVVATTTSVMLLVEEGRLRLSDRAAAFIPEFARYGKGDITIRHLLTHTSGLRPDVDLSFEWVGYDEALRLAAEEVLVAPPDQRFVYSDIGFFVLGEIVARVAGMPFDRFARTRVFEPLGMTDTQFTPPAALRARIAPTETCTPYGWPCDGPGASMLRGVVHDPTARRMAGVAGHAGMFTTARDLARFATMVLGGGALEGRRLLAPLTVARMTAPSSPAGVAGVRGLGWDMDTSYSSNRGELLPPGSFGHTGFTGTSLWIDPATGSFVVFLSSRLHPHGKGDVTSLRAKVATVAASALADVPASFGGDRFGGDFITAPPLPPALRLAPRDPVLTGIDVLRAEGFARLAGRKVGLVTNHTGRARDGATTIDLLHEATNVDLVALFSPEHGIRGTLDDMVPTERDAQTGLVIHSLYGETRRPTAAMLEGIDTLVVDIQDIGARFYTYMSTMGHVLEEAAPRGIRVVVLDRPNPIGGWQIEGPMLDDDARSFVGYFPMPIRHGLTLGELARLFNAEMEIGADLDVVEMRGWTRSTWFDQTGQPWVNPSPNMRNLLQAIVYPGIGAIEGANISVGRGTDTPFEQVGAPWIDGVKLAAELNAAGLAGVSFYPVSFTPTSSKYVGERCEGVFIVITDREALRPVRVGLELASTLARSYPDHLDLTGTERLFGSRESLARARRGDAPSAVAASWTAGEAKWRLLRAKYLIYR